MAREKKPVLVCIYMAQTDAVAHRMIAHGKVHDGLGAWQRDIPLTPMTVDDLLRDTYIEYTDLPKYNRQKVVHVYRDANMVAVFAYATLQ